MRIRSYYEPREGYTHLIDENNCPLKLIQFGVLNLPPGQEYLHHTGEKEYGLIVLGGRGEIKIGEGKWRKVGRRQNVFGGKAYGIYIPSNTNFKVKAKTSLEIAIAQAKSEGKRQSAIISPEEVKVRVVGKGNWEREVHDILDSRVEAKALVVGETFNPPGNWSSYPPHKHDEDHPPEEVKMEELYFFRLHPEGGFGLQRIYTAEGNFDEAYVLKNNTLIAIPKGYHPVVAGGGYRLYYLWILAGSSRELKPRDDPEHTWIKEGG